MKIKLLSILVVSFATIATTELSFGSEKERTSKTKDLIRQNVSNIREHAKDVNKTLNLLRVDDKDLAEADANEMISFLESYKKDNDFLIKQIAFKSELRLAALHKQNISLRQKIVDDVVDAQMEPNQTLNPHPYIWLMEFRAKDFREQTKTKIFDELKKKPSKQIIEICGVADIKEGLPLLKNMLIDEIAYATDPNQGAQWYLTIGWSARLARARMGVKEDINRCIELAEPELNKKPPSVLRLFNDMGYIRQPEAIDFLMRYIFSDERIGEVSPPIPGEPVASYVMGILVDCLENFPIKKREERGYTQEEIEQCRKWMSEQKEWKIIR
jgi:hypothetical protein